MTVARQSLSCCLINTFYNEVLYCFQGGIFFFFIETFLESLGK